MVSLISFSRKSVFITGLLIMTITVAVTGFLAWKSWYLEQTTEYSFQWLTLTDGFSVTFGFYADKYATLLAFVTALLTLVIHIYSFQYLEHEARYLRFTAIFLAFCGAMIGLVYSFNLIQLFLFWELVGVCSYFLIGFWHEKKEAQSASTQAFLYNRLGDVFLISGILWVGIELNSFDLRILSEKGQFSAGIILIFLGAMAKSAQFPLHVWLPNAMAGPTPVSSLLHSATMVAAGVFLTIRIFPLTDVNSTLFILIIGTITAIAGAYLACKENELKRIWAYSSMSQLGLMMCAIGFGYPEIAYFHLITHAFFKCALFLNSGIILHYLEDDAHRYHVPFSADIRLMGNLKKDLPFTFALTLLSSSALISLPLTSGFLSKEGIINAGLQWTLENAGTNPKTFFIFPLIVLLTSAMTAFYVVRTLLLVFWGNKRNIQTTSNGEKTIQEIPPFKESKFRLMLIATVVIALGCLGLIYSPLHPFDVEQVWLLDALDPAISFAFGNVGLVSTLFFTIFGGLFSHFLYRHYHYVTSATHRYAFDRNMILKPIFAFIRFADELLGEILIHKVIIKPFIRFARGVHYIGDVSIIDPLVVGMGKMIGQKEIGGTDVSISALAQKTDDNIVDGLVRSFGNTINFFGIIFKKIQLGRVQIYFLISIIVLLLAFWLGISI